MDSTERFSSRVADYVRYRPVTDLRRLFDEHQVDGRATIDYATRVYVGRFT